MQYLTRILKVLCFSVLCSLAALASAHHGWSWYDPEDFTLTAVVMEKEFGNPHDRMTVQDGSGQEWNLLLSPPVRSRAAGLTGAEIDVGDVITAYGHRHREGDVYEMKTERLQLEDRTYNLYPNRS